MTMSDLSEPEINKTSKYLQDKETMSLSSYPRYRSISPPLTPETTTITTTTISVTPSPITTTLSNAQESNLNNQQQEIRNMSSTSPRQQQQPQQQQQDQLKPESQSQTTTETSPHISIATRRHSFNGVAPTVDTNNPMPSPVTVPPVIPELNINSILNSSPFNQPYTIQTTRRHRPEPRTSPQTDALKTPPFGSVAPGDESKTICVVWQEADLGLWMDFIQEFSSQNKTNVDGMQSKLKSLTGIICSSHVFVLFVNLLQRKSTKLNRSQKC